MSGALSTSEPQHDKTNRVTMRPAKTQISQGIRPVWSESSLCAQWVAKDSGFLRADSEDSDQSDLSFRWTHTHFVGFAMSWLILSYRSRNVYLWSDRLRWRPAQVCDGRSQRLPPGGSGPDVCQHPEGTASQHQMYIARWWVAAICLWMV